MSPSKLHVAVLDDEPAVLKGLRRLLTVRGFSVTEYERGTDLVAAMDSRRFDCLVLDLHMPDLDGFQVLEILRSRSSQVPVVVLTALDGAGIAEHGSRGQDAYASSTGLVRCRLACCGTT